MFNVKINKNIKVKLYSLTIKQYQNFFLKMIKILENNNLFYSITKEQSNNSISLFIQECDELKELDNYINRENNTYNIFSIYTYDSQINNCGIVHNISNIFTKYNIPIIYINTFFENLILVNENDFDKALIGLQLIIDNDNIILLS
jgi:hypothetical protein